MDVGDVGTTTIAVPLPFTTCGVVEAEEHGLDAEPLAGQSQLFDRMAPRLSTAPTNGCGTCFAIRDTFER